MGETISQKILARASGKKRVTPGEFIEAKPDAVVAIGDLGAMSRKIEALKRIGVKKIAIPDKFVVVPDHRVPAHNIDNAEDQKLSRAFVKEQDLKYFYDVGRGGITHQIGPEMGFARPGIFYVGEDTHAPTCGAVGCIAVAGMEDLNEIMALGTMWLRVPESVKFKVTGSFAEGVMSRDLIQLILGDVGAKAVYKTMEFVGPTVEKMSIDSRMAMCCLVTHAGAKTGIVPPDDTTIKYVEKRAKGPYYILKSDADAEYDDTFNYDATKLEPMVAAPSDPQNTKAVAEVEGVEVDQAYIGTCASGRLEDIRIAAKILKGRKVHPRSRLIVTPSSQEIYLNANKEGLLSTIVQAEGIINAPNCGACAGGHMGVLAEGEVCVSTSTLNIPGRMGHLESLVYLASPATVAASAVEGKIADPRRLLRKGV